MNIIFKLTTAGRQALINAKQDGSQARTITSVGVTAATFTPTDALASIPNEIKRLPSIAGDVVAKDTIHITIRDDGEDTYTVRGLGVYLDNGVLLGTYSQAAVILEKSVASILMLATDMRVLDGSVDISTLHFGETNFINPPATTERQGVVELATAAEAEQLKDGQRAMTPASAAKLFKDRALVSTSIKAGTGLKGGGDLAADRTLELDKSGVTADSYGTETETPVFKVDEFGRVIEAGKKTIKPSWSNVQNKPTTRNGYGITDAAPSDHVGSRGGAHALATTTEAGFMSAGDRTMLDALPQDLANRVAIESGSAVLIEGQNVNDLRRTGFFRGHSMPGAPSMGWWFVIHIQHGWDWATQFFTAFGTDSQYTPGTWFKRMRTGAAGWQAFQRVLDSENFNNFAPTLTGAGAMGTWPVSITGDAQTLGGKGQADYQRYRGSITADQMDVALDRGTYHVHKGNYSTALDTIAAGGSTSRVQTEYKYDGEVRWRARIDDAAFSPWWYSLHSGNFNSYAPALNGAGAYGTWSIRSLAANYADNAAAVSWGGVSSKPIYLMSHAGGAAHADTMAPNTAGFTRSAGAPYSGPVVRFAGAADSASNCSLWLNALAGDSHHIAARTQAEDGSIGPWTRLAPYRERSEWVANNTAQKQVVGQIGWNAYGNGHTIIEASAGVAPDGVAVNRDTPTFSPQKAVADGVAIPTLMGYNGSKTYPVRVALAQYMDRGQHWSQDVGAYGSAAAGMVRENAHASSTQTSNDYAPRWAFQWNSRVLNQLGMDANGIFHMWGDWARDGKDDHRDLWLRHLRTLGSVTVDESLTVAGCTGGVVPPGAYLDYAGEGNPVGYLRCNGAAYSRTVYAALFAAIGTRYGAGDGSNTFNVPDLRGLVLRDLDEGRGVDGGRVLGSYQASALGSHTHTGTTVGAGDHTHAGYTTSGGEHGHVMRRDSGGGTWDGQLGIVAAEGWEGLVATAEGTGTHAHGVQTYGGGTHSHSFTTNATGGSETRMANLSGRAFIKY
ncbi:phage tail protein [Comamonas antarctica]|uniref:Tail fiber protein n=1 Tax=Comamonas antarctica TaxID=2743470 RepID=A0A6N1WZL5_9BURK|nr:phage tail protein [Comamonas antarctica]QKV52644.1 tail fiber protein [Comamonas antarctica]